MIRNMFVKRKFFSRHLQFMVLLVKKNVGIISNIHTKNGRNFRILIPTQHLEGKKYQFLL